MAAIAKPTRTAVLTAKAAVERALDTLHEDLAKGQPNTDRRITIRHRLEVAYEDLGIIYTNLRGPTGNLDTLPEPIIQSKKARKR